MTLKEAKERASAARTTLSQNEQVLTQRETELNQLEPVVQKAASQEIPQRKLGSGVTRETQQTVIENRQQARDLLPQIEQQRQDISSARSNISQQRSELNQTDKAIKAAEVAQRHLYFGSNLTTAQKASRNISAEGIASTVSGGVLTRSNTIITPVASGLTADTTLVIEQPAGGSASFQPVPNFSKAPMVSKLQKFDQFVGKIIPDKLQNLYGGEQGLRAGQKNVFLGAESIAKGAVKVSNPFNQAAYAYQRDYQTFNQATPSEEAIRKATAPKGFVFGTEKLYTPYPQRDPDIQAAALTGGVIALEAVTAGIATPALSVAGAAYGTYTFVKNPTPEQFVESGLLVAPVSETAELGYQFTVARQTKNKELYNSIRGKLVKTYGEDSPQVADFEKEFKRAFQELPRNSPTTKPFSVKDAKSLDTIEDPALRKQVIREVDKIIRKYQPEIIGSAEIPTVTTLETTPKGKAGDIDIQNSPYYLYSKNGRNFGPYGTRSKELALEVTAKLKELGVPNVGYAEGTFRGYPKYHVNLGFDEVNGRRKPREFLNIGTSTKYHSSETAKILDPLEINRFGAARGYVQDPYGVRVENVRDQLRIKILYGYKNPKNPRIADVFFKDKALYAELEKKTTGRPKDIIDVRGIVRGTERLIPKPQAGLLENKRGSLTPRPLRSIQYDYARAPRPSEEPLRAALYAPAQTARYASARYASAQSYAAQYAPAQAAYPVPKTTERYAPALTSRPYPSSPVKPTRTGYPSNYPGISVAPINLYPLEYKPKTPKKNLGFDFTSFQKRQKQPKVKSRPVYSRGYTPSFISTAFGITRKVTQKQFNRDVLRGGTSIEVRPIPIIINKPRRIR